MIHLVPCPGCQRHAREDGPCPFCGAAVPRAPAAPTSLRAGRLGRAALLAVGTAVAATSLGGTGCAYGVPPSDVDAAVVDAGQDGAVSVDSAIAPAYGLPPSDGG